MFRLRQIEDSALCKRSGFYRNINGQKVADGFQSSVSGVIGKDPGNIRGDRVDLLIYDECGSWVGLTTAIIQGQELVEVQGVPRGIMLFGGEINIAALKSGKIGEPCDGNTEIN